MSGIDSRGTADRLCQACVELLDVDGAAISFSVDGAIRGTFGASGELSRRLDELQFTFGEGPCVDAVAGGRPVLAADLNSPEHGRWPAFTGAALEAGVQAVFALPVATPATPIGALDLFRYRSGALSDDGIAGGLEAAGLAGPPLLDLLTSDSGWTAFSDGEHAGNPLDSLERTEVYQATGMIMGQLGVGPAEAMARLRAYAFAHGTTASAVAWSIVERRLVLDFDSS